MYLTADAVLKAIEVLRATVHPFVGITFMACKRKGLSVGTADKVSLDHLTRGLMDDQHRLDRRSSYYFQPFKGGAGWWVTDRYPSTGLQTINTQTFANVFIHPRNSPQWGLMPNYVELIHDTLKERNYPSELAADAIAVWLFKDAELGETSSYEDLVRRFFSEYGITPLEADELFPLRLMEEKLPASRAFSPEPLETTSVLRQLPEPPDAELEGGRAITSLRLENVGPASIMELAFGQRLTVVTGDNGLGKSFLLDFAWWASTGGWADRELIPQPQSASGPSQVEFTLGANSGRLATFKATFDRNTFSWQRPPSAMTVEALAVFSRADGSFAVADPVRTRFDPKAESICLSADEVRNGKLGVTEGMIRDWVRWQLAPDRKTFDQFAAALKRLSPEDLGTLTPGAPTRLPRDVREIPTIQHKYGSVPVTHASAGVQRVLLLAYLIIWCWQEHLLAAQQVGASPLRRMMVIVDELEAHLHPKWQRIVLPALMSVGDILSGDLAIQTIAATHSPMILASMEGEFSADTDSLYHLYGAGRGVTLEETPFVKYGDVSGWLTSPLFGLRQARSREAELAIDAAKRLQLEEEPSAEQVAEVSERLKRYLASDDKFWPRWLYFAEEHGVRI